MTKRCEVCGRNFQPRYTTEGEEVYCSHKCAAIGGRKISLIVTVIILIIAVIFQIVSYFTDGEIEAIIVYSTFYIMSSLLLIYAIIGYIAYYKVNKESLDPEDVETQDMTFKEINCESLIYKDECKNNICMICKLEIRIGDRVNQCPHCGCFFHKEHLGDWMRENDNCPVCSAVLVIEKIS